MSRKRSYANGHKGTTLADRLKQQGDAGQRRQLLAKQVSNRILAEKLIDQNQNNGSIRDPDEFLQGLSQVPLRPVGGSPSPISGVYTDLTRAAAACIGSGKVMVVLTWPTRDISVSAIPSLLAAADVAMATPTSVEKNGQAYPSFERPMGLKTLIYPYARTTHTLAREVQIDRQYVHAQHIRHLVRHTSGDGRADGFKDYHQVLARVSTLTGKAKDGRSYPEFEHPTLDEIVPHGACDGKVHSNGGLLWRTSSKTDLKEHSRTGLADSGKDSPYFVFGLKAGENVTKSLRSVAGTIGLAIFDLSRTARNRLGDDWSDDVIKTSDALSANCPDAGILVVTDDPWTFDHARFQIFGRKAPGRVKSIIPAESSTITALSPQIIGDVLPMSWSGAEKVATHGFMGESTALIEDLRNISADLKLAGDRSGRETISDLIGTIRRDASLPGTLSSLSDYVTDERGDALAADFMGGYRITSHAAGLRDLSSAAFQIGGQRLEASLKKAESLIRQYQTSTPMAHLLEEAVRNILHSSSRALFIFRTQTLAEFAVDDLTKRIPELERRLSTRMIVFSGTGGLNDFAGLPASERNRLKKLYVVAPARDGVLSLFAKNWLPEQLIILADTDTLRFSARDAARLAEQLSVPEISARLQRYSTSAVKCVEGMGGQPIRLGEIPLPPVEVTFPSEQIINLVGRAVNIPEVIELSMESRQRIIARPRSGLVLLDTSHSLETFREVDAETVQQGDRLCVIGQGFVDKARLFISISATAADMIRDYHESVVKQFARMPGASDAEKLRRLVAEMDDPLVDVDRARYWVTLDKQISRRIEEVVPHAPQTIETFVRFATALGIAPSLAQRFWHWGVVAQRASKVKAGFAFHDAYKNILTDPHGAMALNADRAADIRRLRLLAEENVSTVLSIRRYKP